MTGYFSLVCRLLGHRWSEWHPYPEHNDIHSRRFCRRCAGIERRWNAHAPFDDAEPGGEGR